MKPFLPPTLRSTMARRRGFLAAVLLATAGMSLPQLPALAQSGAWSAEQWAARLPGSPTAG